MRPSDQLPELKEDASNTNRKAIQETTFSKDVLARYVCNTLDEVKAAAATPATEFTAIVIGSGMYGAFCAERIYRRGGRALVLDAGPFVVSEHVQNMADPAFDVVEAEDLLGKPAFGEFRSPVFNNDAKTPIDYAGHNYNVGGKSVRWGGWSPRLTEEDLALWPAPMADYLRDNYREIEFQIGAFPTADYIRGPLAEAIFERVQTLKGKHDITDVLPAPVAVQAEQPASGLFSFDKFSSLPLLIESLRADAKGADGSSQSPADANSRRALMLVPRCRVLRLETAPSGGGKLRVTHLRVVHGSGPNRRFDLIPVPAGCQVILAANSLESTRLALESFVPQDQVANTRIGRNLQVHLRTDITVRIPRTAFDAALKKAALRQVKAEDAARSALVPPDPRSEEDRVADMLRTLQTAALHIQCSTGKRRFHLQLIAVNDPNGNPEALMYRQDTSLPELTDALGSMRSFWVAVRFILVGEIFPDRSKPVGDESTCWAALSEFERDRVVAGGPPELGSEYSVRKLYTYIRLTREDEDLWLRMDKVALRVAEALAGPGGRVDYLYDGGWRPTPPDDEQLRRQHKSLGSTYHECGTMWMDPDPGKGVVDDTGRLLGVENAFCCDQAVFPTSGSANPVPTGLAVAMRVSEAVAPDRVARETGFTDLFVFKDPVGDFLTLPVAGSLPDGWRFLGGGRFVRRGRMMETAAGIGLLYYRARTFRNFVLKLEWRCPLPRGNGKFFNNAGVYVRWPKAITVAPGKTRDPDELTLEEFGAFGIKQGYEIQIDDTGYRPEPQFSGFPEELNNIHHLTGAVYPAFLPGDPPFTRPRFDPNPEVVRTGSPARELASNAPGEWNQFEITAQGNRLTVRLNGRLVNDAVDHANAFQEGYIGLQNHFNGYRVQFRNLRVKEL